VAHAVPVRRRRLRDRRHRPGDAGWFPGLYRAVAVAWLELMLARISAGPAQVPWTAMGALSLSCEQIVLGGLGRRPRVEARPGLLTAGVPSPGVRLELRVTTEDDDAVVVAYADPRGATRAVRRAAMARVELTLHRAVSQSCPGRAARREELRCAKVAVQGAMDADARPNAYRLILCSESHPQPQGRAQRRSAELRAQSQIRIDHIA
jgi:hypothetical protein